MNLTSPSFVLFALSAALLHRLAPRSWRLPLLLAASYLWYASLDLKFLPLLIAATLADYLLGRGFEKLSPSSFARRALLAASMALNLGILSYFKLWPVAAPLGVSFYTFHSLSYVFDVYRGTLRPERSLLRYALFVGFFPKLLAGPIERFRDFEAKLAAPLTGIRPFLDGCGLFVFGLYLKLVVGDSLALLATKHFEASSPAGQQLLIGVYAYSAQIYADFLGYTLIARGAALWFGISLDQNFASPYLAGSPQDFWRRWHRSLSFWFRDYLYLPLGGNRRWHIRNLLLTMVLAGAWHGAAWQFPLWGLYHGLFLIAGLLLERAAAALPITKHLFPSRALRALSWLLTLHVACFGWIFFRASSVGHAIGIFQGIFSLRTGAEPVTGDLLYLAFFILPWILFSGWLHQARSRDPGLSGLLPRFVLSLAAGAALVLILIFGDPIASPFIYFRF